MFSYDEQRRFEEIERQLQTEDPEFALGLSHLQPDEGQDHGLGDVELDEPLHAATQEKVPRRDVLAEPAGRQPQRPASNRWGAGQWVAWTVT